MHFSKPVTELIRQRTSCRTYEKQVIGAQALGRIEQALQEIPPGPFGGKTRIAFVAASEGDEAALKGLGTYGVIKDPAGFVIGAVQPTDESLVDFSFQMETLVLFLADLGLGTCWLGGSFRKSRFEERMHLAPGETVPAVLSVGHPAGKLRTLERLMRFGVKADKRKPWSELFFLERFGQALSPESAGPYAECLEMVRLAPSASNRQPWRVVHEADSGALHPSAVHFGLKRAPGYGEQAKRIGMADLQMVDMGIAACHFTWCAQAAGLAGKWERLSPGPPAFPDRTEYQFSWVPRNQ